MSYIPTGSASQSVQTQNIVSLQGSTGNISFSNSNNVTFGFNNSTITASVSLTQPTLSSYDNMGLAGSGTAGISVKPIVYNQLQLFPLDPLNKVFPGDMTLNTIGLNMTMSDATSVMSASCSTTVQLGIYSIVSTGNSLSLQLINSAQSGFGFASPATNNSTAWAGARWWTFASSQWSALPQLSANGQYVFGLLLRSSGTSISSASMYGLYNLVTQARSGVYGVSQVNNTWRGFGNFNGVYGTTTVALPNQINYTQINKQSASGNFVPHLQFNNFTNMSAL